MTGLWKNSPYLSWWGRQYADGAVVEECYVYHQLLRVPAARQQPVRDHLHRAERRHAVRLGRLHRGHAPPRQPTGKWVGEPSTAPTTTSAAPGRPCGARASTTFAAFCRAVYDAAAGFAAVKFDVNLDGQMFYPCPPRHLSHGPGRLPA